MCIRDKYNSGTGSRITSTFVYLNIGLTLLEASNDVFRNSIGLIGRHVRGAIYIFDRPLCHPKIREKDLWVVEI